MPIATTVLNIALLLGGSALIASCGEPASSQPTNSSKASQAVPGASPLHPVVVELFQSQGCSSCPPANANINAIADRSDLLVLSFAVTYWDQFGWKDTFDQNKFTVRQWDYAHHANRAQVATPQVIVNGSQTVVGSNRRQLDETIAAAGPAKGGPELSVSGSSLIVGAQPIGTASTVWLVRYDPKSREVAISAGENSGRTLPHRHIVRELVELGRWNGPRSTFAIPVPRETGLSSAVVVQQGTGGPITSARTI